MANKRKPKIVKMKDHKPLGDYEQIMLVRDELLNLSEKLSNKVTIPNMVHATQKFICDLAYDTAPNHTIATHLIQSVINDHINNIIKEDIDEK